MGVSIDMGMIMGNGSSGMMDSITSVVAFLIVLVSVSVLVSVIFVRLMSDV